MYNGRHVVVDIGAEETKLLDVSVSSSSLKVFHAERMTDMTPFIEDGKLINLVEFVASLKDTLKSNDIKCKKLIITSSVLGIHSELTEKANDIQKVIDAGFKQDLAAVNPELEVVDYQIYNTYVTDSKNSLYAVTAKSNVYVVRSLLSALEEAGFTVVNIVDSLTPVLNLMKLYPSSYDVQARLFVNLGHTTQLYVVVKDAPLEVKTFSLSFWTVVESILQQADQPVLKIKSLLNRIGLLRDEQRESELANAGVDPDIYYAIVQEFIDEFKKKLLSQISSWNKLQKYGISNIVVTGGYADMLGLMETLQLNTDYVFTPVVLNFKHKSKSLNITNKCNSDIGAAFAPSLGVLLNSNFKHPLSLRPKRSILRMSENAAVKVITCLIVAAIFVAGYGGVEIFKSYNELQRLEEIEQETGKLRPSLSKLDREVKSKEVYLGALKNVDTLLQPLIQYISDNESETFTVASVDTKNLLMSQDITQDASMTFLDDDEETLLVDDTEDSEAANIKSAIIIRGYALTTDEISTFYAGLDSLAFTDSLKLNGIESVVLPSEEPMYIFEIEIGR